MVGGSLVVVAACCGWLLAGAVAGCWLLLAVAGGGCWLLLAVAGGGCWLVLPVPAGCADCLHLLLVERFACLAYQNNINMT